MSRYDNRKVGLNANRLYSKIFENRGVNSIEQFTTPSLTFPSQEQISRLTLVPHIWKTGDRYFKLSNQYYNDPKKWWIIAFFNQKPTEGHIELGDVIYVPTPLEDILTYYGA